MARILSNSAVLTIKDVADYLQVHTATIYKYAQQGKIPAFKIGSDWRFHRKYIDAWIDERMTGNGNGRRKGKRAGIYPY